MPFEPRLIRPDEPDDSLDLPDDLAELAEQLSADADFLADRYPAQADRRQAAESRGHRRLLHTAAAAVLLCALGLWGGRTWWSPAGRHAVLGQNRSSAHPAAPATVAQMAGNARVHGWADGDAPAPSASGLLLRGLSGGEQEGVFDLLEEQPSDEAQVSI